MVTFDSSSPTQTPSGRCSSSRRRVPRSIALSRRGSSAMTGISGRYFGGSAAQDVLSRPATASDRALHGGRPAGVGPAAGADDVGPRGFDTGPLDARTERDRGVRLSADARPEQLRLAESLRELPGD